MSKENKKEQSLVYRIKTTNADRDIETLIDMISSREIFMWKRIQREPIAMSLYDKQSLIISTLNGQKWGTPIALVDMVGNKNYCKKQELWTEHDMYSKILEEERKNNPNAKYALGEGNHRLTVIPEFINNGFQLRPCTLMPDNIAFMPLVLDRLTYYEELTPYWQGLLLNYVGHVREHIGRMEDIQSQINVYGSMTPKSRAEQRQNFANSRVSDFVYEAQEEYYSKFEVTKNASDKMSCNYVSCNLIKQAGIQEYESRQAYWYVRGIAGAGATDDTLDNFHRGDLKYNIQIPDSDYATMREIRKNTWEPVFLEGSPLLAPIELSKRAKSKLTKAPFIGFGMANIILVKKELHPGGLSVKDSHGWAEWYALADEDMGEKIKTNKSREDFDSEKEWEIEQRTENYRYWSGVPHMSIPSEKRRLAILNHLKKHLTYLLKEGILAVKTKSYFTPKDRRIMRERQNNFDPITDEVMLKDAEAHHKIRQEHGGLTELGNGVMINKETHDYLTHKKQWKYASWDSVIKHKKMIKIDIFKNRDNDFFNASELVSAAPALQE